MIAFENVFSSIISQIQQSLIVIASLRSALACGDRPNYSKGYELVVELLVTAEYFCEW